MKRQLSARELILLGLLLVLVLVGGYLLLFYMPMNAELERLGQETASCQEQLAAAQLRTAEKHRMERELEAIFAADPEPVGIAPYDNLQSVMFELNGILQSTPEYTLSFGTVDTEQAIVRRRIALTFTSATYEGAKRVLGQLHDSAYRCMLDDLQIVLGAEDGEQVSVSASLVFFEYQS